MYKKLYISWSILSVLSQQVRQSTATLPVNQQSSCYNNGRTQGEVI